MTGIIIVGRCTAVGLAHLLFGLCSKKSDIAFKELLFIMYGGMIRGAIAFGLVLKIPEGGGEDGFKERGVVVTTTLAVVIITTVLFGSFMPVIQKVLVPPQDSETIENQDKEDAGNPSEMTFEQKTKNDSTTKI